jgi:LEA14-like dessication related protein
MKINFLLAKTMLWLVSIALFSLSSCISYHEVQVNKVEFRSIKNVTAKGFDVQMAVHVNNPNNYRIKIKRANIDLLVSDNKVGSAAINKKLVLKGKTSDEYLFTINADYKGMASSAIPSIISVVTSGSIPLRATGNLNAKAFVVGKKFDVDYSERVKIR